MWSLRCPEGTGLCCPLSSVDACGARTRHSSSKYRQLDHGQSPGELTSPPLTGFSFSRRFFLVQTLKGRKRRFHSRRSCPSADGHPETMKMREAPWSAAARRRLCIAPTEFLGRRALEGATGASCNSASRDNSKAASSRRTPRCLRHIDFQSRKWDSSWTLSGKRRRA